MKVQVHEQWCQCRGEGPSVRAVVRAQGRWSACRDEVASASPRDDGGKLEG
jgi:hypothetical protein